MNYQTPYYSKQTPEDSEEISERGLQKDEVRNFYSSADLFSKRNSADAPLDQRLKELWSICKVQFHRFCFSQQKLQTAQEAAIVIFSFISVSFSAKEKTNFVIKIFVCIICASLLFEGLTHHSINEALHNKQTARAEKMIHQRLNFMPWDNGLRLRLAHAYLSLGKSNEAKVIIDKVHQSDPRNSYLSVVALELSRTLKSDQKITEAIKVLEKAPLQSCKECSSEIQGLYTLQGRKALVDRNMQTASYYLGKALSIAMMQKESDSSIANRKRELAKVYNFQAESLIKAQEYDKAITILEKAIKLAPMSATYLTLANQYTQRKQGVADLRKAIEAYREAYSLGMIDAESGFKKAINELKYSLKKKGTPKAEIDKEIEKYKLVAISSSSSASVADKNANQPKKEDTKDNTEEDSDKEASKEKKKDKKASKEEQDKKSDKESKNKAGVKDYSHPDKELKDTKASDKEDKPADVAKEKPKAEKPSAESTDNNSAVNAEKKKNLFHRTPYEEAPNKE